MASEKTGLLSQEPSPLQKNSTHQLDTPSSGVLPYAPHDDPPPYAASEEEFRTIRCEVCKSELSIAKSDNTLTVYCSSCRQETPTGPPPPGQRFVRCSSCSSLFTCHSESPSICPNCSCGKLTELSSFHSEAQATPTAPPPPSPQPAYAPYGTIPPNTNQSHPYSNAARFSRANRTRKQIIALCTAVVTIVFVIVLVIAMDPTGGLPVLWSALALVPLMGRIIYLWCKERNEVSNQSI